MEAEEKERTKALREGKVASVGTGSVVRVVKKEKDIEKEVKQAEEVKKVEDKKGMEELGLPTRIVNSLEAAGIKSVAQLEALTDEELTNIKGLGEKSIKDIKKALK
jgi:DNA-directed RNA polymerase alpha subunit